MIELADIAAKAAIANLLNGIVIRNIANIEALGWRISCVEYYAL
jgi:hypothetical protein